MRVRVDQRVTDLPKPGRYPRQVLRPVILSGGAGTRLWPLSTPETPKQFTHLLGDRSLFAMTLARLAPTAPVVVTGEAHLHLVAEAARTEGIVPHLVIAEPVPRNTTPAAVAAALLSDPADILVILPSDHIIADEDGFRSAVEVAAAHAGEAIVTFGVRPDRPETGYGYIEVGPAVDGAHRIVGFAEKPSVEVARTLASDGKHLWNSGMFVVAASLLLDEVRRYHPGMVEGVESALGEEVDGVVRLVPRFETVESISIDHAIMEKTERGRVVHLDVGWDDLGSYRSLLEASALDPSGNHTHGDVVLSGVTGSYVRATTRRVVVAGMSDVVVVETPDAVLVIPLDRAQDVRDLQ